MNKIQFKVKGEKSSPKKFFQKEDTERINQVVM